MKPWFYDFHKERDGSALYLSTSLQALYKVYIFYGSTDTKISNMILKVILII